MRAVSICPISDRMPISLWYRETAGSADEFAKPVIARAEAVQTAVIKSGQIKTGQIKSGQAKATRGRAKSAA